MSEMNLTVLLPQQGKPSSATLLLANEPEASDLLPLLTARESMVAVISDASKWEDVSSMMEEVLTAFESHAANFTRLYLIGGNSLSELAWTVAGAYSRVLAGCCINGGAEHLVPVRDAKFLPIRAYAGEKQERFSAQQLIRSLRTIGSEWADFVEEEFLSSDALTWLFSQTKETQYEVHWLKPGLWSIEAGAIESFYLIEGEEKALLVDTGMNQGPVLPLVRSLTKLPVELALTHAHGDHMLHVDEFDKVYCSPREGQLPMEFLHAMMPGVSIDFTKYIPVEEGDVIDLGGVKVEVLAAYGHTPGSVVFVDHAHRCLFSGDAFGSGTGVLMAIPGTMNVSDLLESVKHFLTYQETLKDYIWYGGHRCQEFGEQKHGEYYNPLCFEVLEDFVVLCEKLLNHDETLFCEPGTNSWVTETVYTVSYQKAAMWVVKSKIC